MIHFISALLEIELSCIWWTTCSWAAVLLDQPCCRRDCIPALTIRHIRSLLEESAIINLIIGALERNRGLLSPPFAERDRWKVVNFPGDAGGTELRVFRCNNEIRFEGPCQDAGEGFGFQEESEVEALLNCESTSYPYCCEFGVPCDCWTVLTDFICCNVDTLCI